MAASVAAVLATEAPPSVQPRPFTAGPRATPAAPIIEGTVRGPGGKPVEGALVVAWSLAPSADEHALSTRTDAQGRFRFESKRAQAYRVRVEAPGLAIRTISEAMPGSPLTLDLARGGTIEGIVRDGETGQPAPGIRVETREKDVVGPPDHLDAGRIETVTDAEGRFTLRGLAPGRHALVARGRGYASRNAVPVGTHVELLLQPASMLSGAIKGPDGRSVAGAVVTALAVRSSHGHRSERSDGRGRYEVNGLVAGLYDVAVRARELAPGVVPNVAVNGRGDVRVDVTLQPGSRVTGRLLGADDKPIAGEVAIGEIDGHPAPYVLADLLRALAGMDGRFAIDAVPAGSHALGARAPGLAPKRVDLEVSATQRVVDVGDVKMEAGLTIRGRVRTLAGEPVARASLSGYASGSHTSSSAAATTDEAGRFAMAGLEPLTYRLSARAPGFGTTSAEAEPGTEVELTLETAGSISGRVVDDRGHPIESFRVVARPAAQGKPSASDRFDGRDGRFALNDVSPGAYAVTVRAPEHAPASVSATVASGGPADVGTVRLGAGSTLRGTVVDTVGAAVGGARITLTPSSCERITTTWGDEPEIVSGSSGAFEARGIEASGYEVTASHPRYARSLPVEAVLEAGRPAPQVRLVLTEGSRIEGTYLRRDGTPVSASFVVATPIREEPWHGGPLVPVQPDGTFMIEHVPAGRVRVTTMTSAGRGTYRSAQAREVVVNEGETARLDIVNREVLLTGRVTRAAGPASALRIEAQGRGTTTFGARGQPVPHAAVAGPERMTAVTREDGTFEMIVDEPGTLRMTIGSEDRRLRLPARTIEVPESDSHSVELAFDGVLVTGTVIDRDTEAPVPYASVVATSRSPRDRIGASPTATAGADGRFQLELEPGEYGLLGTGREQSHAHDSVRISVGPAGLADVRLPLPRGLRIAGRALDASGRPVPAVRLNALAIGADSTSGADALADGSFHIRGLKNAAHRVTAWSDSGWFAIRPSVGAGTTDLLLRMQPAARLAVQVVDSNGQPVSGVTPTVRNVDGAPNMSGLGFCRAPTDAQGRTELLAPAGRIIVSANAAPPGGYASVEVAPGEATSVRVVVQPLPAHLGGRD